ncbi:hypothetical protein F4778DRAFT_359734 [Xylariomycetidae sp. FL2044]|nr:hypothetical protein F4778DRAFT_359734 [Xylariomycetidae sp. FL2044]
MLVCYQAEASIVKGQGVRAEGLGKKGVLSILCVLFRILLLWFFLPDRLTQLRQGTLAIILRVGGLLPSIIALRYPNA